MKLKGEVSSDDAGGQIPFGDFSRFPEVSAGSEQLIAYDYDSGMILKGNGKGKGPGGAKGKGHGNHKGNEDNRKGHKGKVSSEPKKPDVSAGSEQLIAYDYDSGMILKEKRKGKGPGGAKGKGHGNHKGNEDNRKGHKGKVSSEPKKPDGGPKIYVDPEVNVYVRPEHLKKGRRRTTSRTRPTKPPKKEPKNTKNPDKGKGGDVNWNVGVDVNVYVGPASEESLKFAIPLIDDTVRNFVSDIFRLHKKGPNRPSTRCTTAHPLPKPEDHKTRNIIEEDSKEQKKNKKYLAPPEAEPPKFFIDDE
ncbi:unnamed protein product [Chrysodeixis includens]|uniref:Uncharacterized protein n=1 Tax=Chrysodeixis includens TaxID=689277 RepID=A0A9N8KWA6_CHRIL|nr:unnamed protein product [Chrysodeixis includens]